MSVSCVPSDSPLRTEAWAVDPHGMGVLDEEPRRLEPGKSLCPYCGLPADRVATLAYDWVLLEPDMEPG